MKNYWKDIIKNTKMTSNSIDDVCKRLLQYALDDKFNSKFKVMCHDAFIYLRKFQTEYMITELNENSNNVVRRLIVYKGKDLFEEGLDLEHLGSFLGGDVYVDIYSNDLYFVERK